MENIFYTDQNNHSKWRSWIIAFIFGYISYQFITVYNQMEMVYEEGSKNFWVSLLLGVLDESTNGELSAAWAAFETGLILFFLSFAIKAGASFYHGLKPNNNNIRIVFWSCLGLEVLPISLFVFRHDSFGEAIESAIYIIIPTLFLGLILFRFQLIQIIQIVFSKWQN